MKKLDGYRQTAKSGLAGILPDTHTFTLMIKHEEKFCPRCRASFECRVGSIALCECNAVKLNDEERNYLQKCFSDCLARNA